LEIGEHEKQLEDVKNQKEHNTTMQRSPKTIGSTDKSDTRDSIGITADLTNQTMLNEPTHTSCGHRDHSTLENFMQETDPSFCKQGRYCHGKMCRDCKALFDEEIDGDVKGQLFVKPTNKIPVWVCIGQTIDLCRC
jgi:hypothetical protein